MIVSVRAAAFAALCPILLLLFLAAAEAGPEPVGPAELKPPVVPDCSALVLIKEAGQFIQDPLTKHQGKFSPATVPVATIRSNALMIALVAQNRMAAPGADARRFAALRDAALKLVAEAGRKPCDLDEVRRLVGVLNRFPDIPPARDSSPTPVRLKNTFTHDEVAVLFGGCGIGNKTHRTEFHLFKLSRQKTPYTAEEADRIELIAYKVGLIAELLREMDDFLPEKRRDERPEWARLAGEVRQSAWELAATARGGNTDDTRRDLRKLNQGCITCHEKFRDCN